MKNIKTFETWNDNIIDNSLFSSGKAKYDPKVVGNSIQYKTGNTEPYYYAELTQKGNSFICKIYKKKKNGDVVRLRNKIKKELKLAHNYIREFLNQRLKKKKKSKSKEKDDEFLDRIYREESEIQQKQQMEPMEAPAPYMPPPPTRKTIIRRF